MKKRGFIIPIILLGVVTIGSISEVWAVPPFPHTFYGTAKKDGANVPDGTVISAWIGGTQYVTTETFTSGGDSVYSINVPGDDPETTATEGGVNGNTVSFRVGSDIASQTAVFSSGSLTNLNLTTVVTLTVSVVPFGVGSVTRNPDQSTYVYGDQVLLTATANPGYTFSNWSGDASGTTNPITITMNGNQTVTANFTQDHYTLTVSVVPFGVGSVTRNPDQPTYVYGSQVQLTATANPGYTFSNWSGGASGATNPITITMNGNQTVTANFTQDHYTLTVSVVPFGVGSVTRNPDQPTYVYGSQVQLTATANPGYTFSNWSGGASGATNPITITMNGNQTVTANFTQDHYTLTVSVVPFGVGSVTRNPDQPTYVYGSQVQLTATANPGYTFSNWSGGASGATNPITITMNGNQTVTANFTQDHYTLTVSVVPFGVGSVTRNPDQPTYVYGSQVQLTATANPGYTFSNWSGGASGATNPITITMNGNTSVTANFIYSLEVLLKAGYNLVSFPTIAGEILITELCSSISGKYETVYAYEGCNPGDPWKIYDPDLPSYANDLQYVDGAMGIWIEATQDTEITVEGLFPSSLSIPLCAGWNLISYAGDQAKPVEEALSSISGKYERVYSYRADDITDPWKIYDVSVPSWVNDLTTMEPGLGYWIYINENCTLAINN